MPPSATHAFVQGVPAGMMLAHFEGRMMVAEYYIGCKVVLGSDEKLAASFHYA